MKKELSKAYEPKNYEEAVYRNWENSGFFAPDVCVKKGIAKKNSKPFSIVLPPPNVTGTLHMGHAVMLAIQDVLIRYHRMLGDKTLWVPGTDHAAVATEAKVEKMLIDSGMKKPKETLGREKFLERVRAFAQESHDTIVNQSKKMGASLDWSREAYTLDDARNLAVRTMFKMMYDDSLIYRGYRVVNWSVAGQSTCSDDELVYVERPAKLYTFRYSKDFPIAISTTRPETKLGDTAVAVNPNDSRYSAFIGKIFTADVGSAKPLSIKIIADEGVDMAFGTGALGVTPAHSSVDFDMYVKQKADGDPIDIIQVIGEDGRMTGVAGQAYAGLTVDDARKKFVDMLREKGLLEKEEDIVQNVGASDRFKDVVEPLPKTQWFVDVNKSFKMRASSLNGIKKGQTVTLKQLMQYAVKSGLIDIIPDRFNKTYFQWIDNLRDWCISRQIWFGHRIPVWYRGDEVFCGAEAPEGDGWQQDPDTLDTWFSSGLWTFSTLGWPNKTKDLKTFHPTSVLETGYDILFFWVARMILMSTYALGEIPFEKVYLHGLVRDEQGRKMSKSLGNIIDPLDMIQKYGTDATRLSLMIGSTPGNDTKLSEVKVEGFRNFANKLWNISRFMLLNIENPTVGAKMPKPKTLADKWIISKLDEAAKDVTKHIESFSFSMAGEKLRDFTWGELADWYLEAAKIEGGKGEMLNYILNTILKLWHPFMPFVTEAIWNEVYGGENLLMANRWPAAKNKKQSLESKQFEIIKNIITNVRVLRSQYKVAQALYLNIFLKTKNNAVKKNSDIIERMARGEVLFVFEKKSHYVLAYSDSDTEVFVDLYGAVDIAKEKIRLQKEIETVEPYASNLEKKLGNEQFVNNAPAMVVEAEKNKLAEAKEKLIKLKTQLENLK